MATPSYGGETIFGLAVQMRTVINPSADQVNSFFGANGNESLFGGTRGRLTEVEGLLFGETFADLATAEEEFVSFNDGIPRNLVDTRGVVYSYVKFAAFQPQGRIINDGRAAWRPYKATFSHLV